MSSALVNGESDVGVCICGAAGVSQLRRLVFPNGRRLFQCTDCGVERLWPRPVSTNTDTSLYSDPGYLDGINEAEHYGYFRAIYDHALEAEISPESRILDFGAGSCHYQLFLQRMGYRAVESVEVNPHLVDYARRTLGLPNIHSSLEEVGSKQFDLIFANQVMEHIYSPWELIHGELLRLLAPGGTLVLSVPNAASLNRHVLGARWIGWSPAEHIWFFDSGSIRKAFARSSDFVVSRCLVRSAVNSVHDAFRPSTLIKRVYYQTVMRIFESMGRGDQLIVVLRNVQAIHPS